MQQIRTRKDNLHSEKHADTWSKYTNKSTHTHNGRCIEVLNELLCRHGMMPATSARRDRLENAISQTALLKEWLHNYVDHTVPHKARQKSFCLLGRSHWVDHPNNKLLALLDHFCRIYANLIAFIHAHIFMEHSSCAHMQGWLVVCI